VMQPNPNAATPNHRQARFVFMFAYPPAKGQGSALRPSEKADAA